MGEHVITFSFFELASGEHPMDGCAAENGLVGTVKSVGVCCNLQLRRDVAGAMHAWDDVDLTCAARPRMPVKPAAQRAVFLAVE